MARAESITFEEFRTRFSTEEICRAELFRLWFPNGFFCPKCGCTEYYRFADETRSSAAPAGIKRPSRLGRSCTAHICR